MLKRRQKENFDRHHGARTLPTLSPGDKVWVPDQEAEGRVIEEVMPQSFEVSIENGTYRRNRRHLIRASSPSQNREDNQSNTPELGTEEEDSEPDTTHSEPQMRRSNRIIKQS